MATRPQSSRSWSPYSSASSLASPVARMRPPWRTMPCRGRHRSSAKTRSAVTRVTLDLLSRIVRSPAAAACRRAHRRPSLRPMPIPVGGPIALEDVVAVADGAPVELPEEALARIRASRAVVEKHVAAGETVYGVTTGIGSLATVRISPEQAAKLQEDIVRSHATAVGPALSREETRAMLFLRAHVLALGYSGVRPEIVELMLEMLNRDVVPVVPERGSLGASGDLAPLAHLALPLIGGGEAVTADARRPGRDALASVGLQTVVLDAKEGLALVNGTQGMLAIGVLAAERARGLALAAAMSVEAALGTDRPFDERLQRLRPHPGQAASAANLRRLTDGSDILASHRESGHLVQDAYSLRCAPQVHGAFRDVLAFVQGVLERESSSISD